MTSRSSSPTTAASRYSSQRGSGHVVVLTACLLMVAVFAAGWTVNKHQKDANGAGEPATAARSKTSTDNASAANEVRWQFGGPERGWFVMDDGSGKNAAPKCPSSVLANSMVDTSKATALLAPGQYRGTDYKAHGGFRYDNSNSTDIQVKLPFDGRLVGLTRYLEAGEVQYMLTFEQPCGIRLRFDHLYTLTDDFAKIAATTPEPRVDDSRSQPLETQPSFKTGTVVATAIGHPASHNTSLDIGIYDLRQPNQISKNAAWAAIHGDKAEQTFYGVCWLSWLPRSDAGRAEALLRKLPKTDQGASDYCTDAPGGTTLSYNSGQPAQH